MTAPQQSPQPIRFQGAPSAASDTALKEILEHAGKGQKLLGKALRVQDGDSGLSVVTFIQNNLVALLPKWVVSRSPLESVEFSFLEVAESSLLYFALPLMGNRVFQPMFQKLAKKELQNVATQKAAQTGVKAATILSTFGVTLLGGEFVTHYVKNLITAKIFKKDRFSDVVNLSQGEMKSDEPSHVVKKCENRIKQCLAACVGILGVSAILAKGSGEGKKNVIARSAQNAITKSAEFLAKELKFDEGKNGKLCLSPRQMRLYMALAVFAYMDSARDKLERVETASRLAVILPYLAFGQGLLVKGMLKLAPKDYFSSIMKDPTKREIASINELATKALDDAQGDAAKALTQFSKPLRRKAVLTGVPLAFGVFGTGIGVGLLNRFWTQYRYKKQVAEQPQLQSTKPASPTAALPATPMPSTVAPAGFSAYSSAPALASPAAPIQLPFANQPFQSFNHQAFTNQPAPPMNGYPGTQLPTRYPIPSPIAPNNPLGAMPRI